VGPQLPAHKKTWVAVQDSPKGKRVKTRLRTVSQSGNSLISLEPLVKSGPQFSDLVGSRGTKGVDRGVFRHVLLEGRIDGGKKKNLWRGKKKAHSGSPAPSPPLSLQFPKGGKGTQKKISGLGTGGGKKGGKKKERKAEKGPVPFVF